MTHEEVTHLVAENMQILARLSRRLQSVFEYGSKKSRQQMSFLIRLYLVGRIKLKDFANREAISTAGLCGILRKLEQAKLVVRSDDANDHRDVWYEVSKSGKNLAEKLIDKRVTAISDLCKVLPEEEEDKLAESMRSVNEILKKMEALNA
ncbi:MAG: MarR family transcriptional regulator [Alphaproteobacteria bacterium]|nr:MarR family transcriptional regulator [Alphaproteobacteria bacterium]MBQ6011655.1 MarR family transcriptional regulator [Alphaproteobacteria bacterium]